MFNVFKKHKIRIISLTSCEDIHNHNMIWNDAVSFGMHYNWAIPGNYFEDNNTQEEWFNYITSLNLDIKKCDIKIEGLGCGLCKYGHEESYEDYVWCEMDVDEKRGYICKHFCLSDSFIIEQPLGLEECKLCQLEHKYSIKITHKLNNFCMGG